MTLRRVAVCLLRRPWPRSERSRDINSFPVRVQRVDVDVFCADTESAAIYLRTAVDFT